jgi:hypothetical protein
MSKPESDIPLTERDDISEARRDLRWAERALLDAESELDDAKRLVSVLRRHLRELEAATAAAR